MKKEGLVLKFRKAIALAMGVWLLFPIILGVVVLTAPKQAQAIPVEETMSITGMLKWAWDKVKDITIKGIITAGKTAVDAAITTALQQMAYDAAMQIVSGGEGQQPLFRTEGWGAYFENIGKSALADSLQRFSQNWEFTRELGISACEPGINLKLAIMVGLIQPYAPRIPQCDWKTMIEGWDSLISVTNEEALNALNQLLQPAGSDIGIYLALTDAISARESAKKTAEEHEDILGRAFRPLSTKSGQIMTPAQASEKMFGDIQETNKLLYTIKAGGAYVTGAAGVFASVFFNTLASKALEKFIMEGLYDPTEFADLSDLFNKFGGGGTTPGGREKAGAKFAALKTTQIQDEGVIELFGELRICPSGARQSIYNCTVGEGLFRALQEVQNRGPITLKQARQEGLILDWPLVPSGIDNTPENCVKAQKYCHADLVKLRKLRIIPIGWELAAELVKEHGAITLFQAMDRFDDDGSPWYRLVDPDWILKIPVTQCKAKTYSELLMAPGSNQRLEVCVDTPSCIEEDEKGQCVGGWGYCLEEEKFWRLGGDRCKAQFASCRTLKKEGGEQASLVIDSVDRRGCTGSTAVGCKQYSTWKNDQGEWIFGGKHNLDFVQARNVQRENSIYLNQMAGQCGIQDVGCAELTSEVTGAVFLKAAPPYMNCYDMNRGNDDRRCSNFIKTCKEPGCELYTPLAGGDDITGAVTEADRCDSTCVGYENYITEPLWWDMSDERLTSSSVNFIPRTAKSCPMDAAGCEEYTNLDVVAQGGEGKEYYSFIRQCVKPGNDEAFFYTWEGTDESGYQLKTWPLLPSNADAGPCTNVNPLTNQCADAPAIQASCAEGDLGSSPNCRRFYNQGGEIFYRLYNRTILASADCHPYRKTLTDVTGDGVTNAGDCPLGHFDAGKRECRFQAIPEQGSACGVSDVGCRLYRGPRAGAARVVFKDTFESEHVWTGGPWAGGRYIETSADATEPGGHSLRIIPPERQAGQRLPFKAIRPIQQTSGEFNVSFWAKYENTADYMISEGLVAQIGDIILQTGRVHVAEEWSKFSVGPFRINEPLENLTLRISGAFSPAPGMPASAGGRNGLFIDNVELRDTNEVFSVINNSWITPMACDQPAPGAQLHCRAYRARNGQQVNFKSWNSCSASDVGCLEFTTEFNLSNNENGAEFNIVNDFAGDDAAIPSPKTFYAINDPAFSCKQEMKGCQEVGVYTDIDATGRQINLETTFIINNPDRYVIEGEIPGALCQGEQEFCNEYQDTKGGKHVFKDFGQRTCLWREAGGDLLESGWYRSGTDFPCEIGFPQGIPDGFIPRVGMCPREQDFCVEFIDASPAAAGGEAKSYFVIKNGKVDEESCAGQVDREQGCVLFNDTSKKETPFSTVATYARNDVKGGAVGASACSDAEQAIDTIELRPDIEDFLEKIQLLGSRGYSCRQVQGEETRICTRGLAGGSCQQDSNTVLKVDLDRKCASWLECRAKQKIFNERTGQFRDICRDLARCTDYDPESKACTSYEQRPAEKLVVGSYKERNILWEGVDWSGYSIPNQWPAENIKAGINPQGERFIGVQAEQRRPAELEGCLVIGGFTKPDGAVCSTRDDRPGFCSSGLCVVPSEEGNEMQFACRGFPEADSPFPPEVVLGFDARGDDPPWNQAPVSFIQGFERVNTFVPKVTVNGRDEVVYHDIEPAEQCHYNIFGYGTASASKFFTTREITKGAAPKGICVGGSIGAGDAVSSADGKTCDPLGEPEIECGRGGSCQALNKVSSLIGWEGLCLEKDKSITINGQPDQYACLTWLPVDQVGFDIFNDVEAADVINQIKASGNLRVESLAYCAEAKLGVTRPYKMGCSACPSRFAARSAPFRINYTGDVNEMGEGMREAVLACAALNNDNDYRIGEETSASIYFAGEGTDGCDEHNCAYYCIPRGFNIFEGSLQVDCSDTEARFGNENEVEIMYVVRRREMEEVIDFTGISGTVSNGALECRGTAILGEDFGLQHIDRVPADELVGVCVDAVFLSDSRSFDITGSGDDRAMLKADKFYEKRQDPRVQNSNPFTVDPGQIDQSALNNGIDVDETEGMRYRYYTDQKSYYANVDAPDFFVSHDRFRIPDIEICVNKNLGQDNADRYKLYRHGTPCFEIGAGYEYPKNNVGSGSALEPGSYAAFSAKVVNGAVDHISESLRTAFGRLGQLAYRYVQRYSKAILQRRNLLYPRQIFPLEEPIKPTIASIRQTTPGAYSVEVLDAISVDNKSSGDLVGVGVFNANVSFYAWAESDQSPLREVFVNWLDGNPALVVGPVRVQNHKPFCDERGVATKECAAAGVERGITCKENKDCLTVGGPCADGSGLHFGNSSDEDGANACTPKSFMFSHPYVFKERGNVPCERINNFSRVDDFRGRRCTVYENAPAVTVSDWWGTQSDPVRFRGRIIVVEPKR